MLYELNAQDFSLRLEVFANKYEACKDLPDNSGIDIYLRSGWIQANLSLDMDIYGFAFFTRELKKLYQNLTGKAIFTTGNDSFIEFSGDGRGNIFMEGELSSDWTYKFKQKVVFKNTFDQSYLGEFANDMYHDYEKFLI